MHRTKGSLNKSRRKTLLKFWPSKIINATSDISEHHANWEGQKGNEWVSGRIDSPHQLTRNFDPVGNLSFKIQLTNTLKSDQGKHGPLPSLAIANAKRWQKVSACRHLGIRLPNQKQHVFNSRTGHEFTCHCYQASGATIKRRSLPPPMADGSSSYGQSKNSFGTFVPEIFSVPVRSASVRSLAVN